jgi:glycosyltransferase involved in cell wall biosynthesis
MSAAPSVQPGIRTRAPARRGATPRVSVGLPVYNGERYLALALDSLLGQTYGDFELIISDNASTDATEEICRSYAVRDHRIRYVRSSENRGAAWNFNNAFRLSSGEYFRWACYDDLCAPSHLETLVHELDASPAAVVLCYTKTRVIGENGEFVEDYEDLLDLREETARRRLVHLLRGLRYAHPTYGLMRREAVARTRLHGGYPADDLVWLGEMALLGQWREVPERLFYRRLHPEISTRANTTREQMAAWCDPANKGKIVTETWRLTAEFLRAIHRTPMTRTERAATYATFLPVYIRASRKQLVREALEVTVAAAGRPVATLAQRVGGSSVGGLR